MDIEKRREYQRNWRKNNPRYAEKHRADSRRWKAKADGMSYYKKNVANGKCRVCPETVIAGSKTMCRYHWFANVAVKRMGKMVFAQALQEKMEGQSYRCAYTGEALIPAVNCSLDHIKPVSKFPELRNDINNVQWVLHDVNMAKRSLDESTFISLCRKIANHRS